MINIAFGVSFTDINTHWAKNDISTLANNELVSGYEDNTFRPTQKIKRDEFIAIVMRLLEEQLGKEKLDSLLEQSLDKSDLLPWEEEYDEVYDTVKHGVALLLKYLKDFHHSPNLIYH